MDKKTKTEDAVMTIEKKWVWGEYFIRRTNNRLKIKLTDWQPRNCKRSQVISEFVSGGEMKMCHSPMQNRVEQEVLDMNNIKTIRTK